MEKADGGGEEVRFWEAFSTEMVKWDWFGVGSVAVRGEDAVGLGGRGT